MPVVVAGLLIGWSAVASAWWNVAVYIHELGHVAVTELLGGDADHFVVYPNGGGFAPVTGLGGWRLNAALAAGYLTSAVVGACCLWATARMRSGRRFFIAAAAASVVAWRWLPPGIVDGPDGPASGRYTWFVSVSVTVAATVAAAVPWPVVRRVILAAMAGLCVGEFIRSMNGFLTGGFDRVATDVATLSQATGIGQRGVAAMLGLQGAVIIAIGVRAWLRAFRQR